VQQLIRPLCYNIGMCGRFTLRAKLNLLLDQFAAELHETRTFDPRFNIAPTQEVLALRHPRQLVALRWGLIPSWAKDAKIASSTINARAETVADKPAFRSAFARRRCLVLADGYYEWLRAGQAKRPYLYEMEDRRPFAMAGLWESWQGIETCTVITTDANELAGKVHDRMPVILPPEEYALWLDPEFQDRGKLLSLLAPFPADEMTARPVSPFVNNARHQGEACIAPAETAAFD
jgi:putative SOS response-associated peptidase YedK